jgi:pre-mRNA-processing factor 6
MSFVCNDLLIEQVSSASDSASGKTTVDPKGYMTGLNSIMVKTDTEIGDIKKARELLKSVITTNPKHAPGWIAAARVEEIDGKIGQARSLIARGCDECPKSEDIWIEAARLNTQENARVILANAVHHSPHSVKIWLQAMALESDTKAKRRVLRKALEYIPNSVKLWVNYLNN